MYEIASAVDGWRARATPAVVARVVDVRGISSRWPDAAWATDGSTAVGGLLAGAADEELRALAARALADGAAVLSTVVIEEDAAQDAGLSCGGTAEVLVQPVADIPDRAWADFAASRPVALRTEVASGRTSTLAVHSAPPGGVHDTDGARELVSVYRPVSRLLVVGTGLLADALVEQARLLGWDPAVVAADTEDLAGGLGPADGLVVLTHDPALDVGPLAAGLQGRAGYVAAIGSRHTQVARRGRLDEAGVPAGTVERLHGPAGLRIGSATPAEIALSIVAEMLAVLRG